MIRTKIIATMGPAVASAETLYSLFEAGVDICRLNFSHGTLDQHAQTLKLIRDTAARFEHPIAVLGDLCGPKIRVGQVADINGSGGMPVTVGDEIVVQRDPIVGENLRISCTLESLIDDVQIGDRILVEDGMLRFVVTDKTADEFKMACTVGGIVKSRKGINLPNTNVTVPSITEQDWECVDWAIANDLDFLALSFVRRAKDLELLRGHLQYKKAESVSLIAKIEKAEALADIDAIIAAADGLMVARGDLGVEMDVSQVPIIQKDLIHRAQRAGKPVIVATQMLQSMIDAATPTRAEISDVANAIFDGTDAVMLSAETSVGKFPILAVHTMAHTAKVTEDYLDKQAEEHAIPPRLQDSADAAAALARGAWRIVTDLKAKLVVIWSETGSTARVFSKHRFNCPIVAISSDPRTLRRMAIHYGVVPNLMSRQENISELFEAIDRTLIERKYAKMGDRTVIVAGWSPTTPYTMNGIIIHSVGDKWSTLSATGLKRENRR